VARFPFGAGQPEVSGRENPGRRSTLRGVADLLVVEDDDAIGNALTTGLRAHGHAVSLQRNARGALDAVAGRAFDLVLLDLGLPDLDGVEVCRRVRAAQPGTVIVVLTARTEEMDVVVGLEAGADDYLTKPFRFGELLARVRAHLRRSAVLPTAEATVCAGDLVIDLAARRATVAGTKVVLRTKEFDLLARLAAHAGTAVSRDALMADVWDAHWYGSTKTLDVHVAAVRRKLARAAAESGGRAPKIVTLRGHGYRLDRPPG
jgi:DNA-binding response OmpR family regulator